MDRFSTVGGSRIRMWSSYSYSAFVGARFRKGWIDAVEMLEAAVRYGVGHHRISSNLK